MACQKVCQQGRDDSMKAKVNIKLKAKPYPYIFSHYSLTACLRAESVSLNPHKSYHIILLYVVENRFVFSLSEIAPMQWDYFCMTQVV